MKLGAFAFLKRGVINSEQLLQTELRQDKQNQVFTKKSRDHCSEPNDYCISMKQSVFALLKSGVTNCKQLLQTELRRDK